MEAGSAAAAMTMATFLSMVGEVLNAAVGWIGVIVTVIVDNPIFMLGIIISFIGVGIGLVSRLLHL